MMPSRIERKTSALRQERHQHRNALAVGTIGIRAEFGREEAFFHARLLPEPKGDQGSAKNRCYVSNRMAGCDQGADQSGIDRMANQPVGPVSMTRWPSLRVMAF